MHDLALTQLVALAIFVVTYFGLAVGGLPGLRVDRTGVAIIGAAAMVVTEVVPWDQAVAAIDARTLVLLFGMMVVAAALHVRRSESATPSIVLGIIALVVGIGWLVFA